MDFRRDLMPVIDRRCVVCHDADGAPPRLDGGLRRVADAGGNPCFNRAYTSLLASRPSSGPATGVGKYVHPGRSRTSPLIWHLFGRNTSRPWDGDAARGLVKTIPRDKAAPLTDAERQKWIDGLPDLAGRWVAAAEQRGYPARSVLEAFMDEFRRRGGEPLRDWDAPQ